MLSIFGVSVVLYYNLSFADLLQLVKTTYSTPVDNKFYQSTCMQLAVDHLQQNCRRQAAAVHVNASWYRFDKSVARQ